MARLGQAFAATGAPDETLQLIAGARSIDDAMDRLAAAGLLPSEEESRRGLTSWFTPLLEPGCDQLDADLLGSSFLGMMRAACADYPAELEEDLPAVLGQLILQLQYDQSPEVLAMMRVLAAVGPAEIRPIAADAAAKLVAAGLADLPWAEGLGAPQPGACFGYGDDLGEQLSVVVSFRYGRKAHAVAVLIDNVLGGGIKDCWVSDRTPDSIRNRCRAAAREPGLQFFDLEAAQARAILEQALARPPCPEQPDQIDDVGENLELLRSRLVLLPEASADMTPGAAVTRAAKATATTKAAGKAAKSGASARAGTRASAGTRAGAGARTAPSTSVHRVKVTLRGTKPPIWRRLEVPSELTLSQLHSVIQRGFGWEGGHMWVFETPAGDFGVPDADLGFRAAASQRLSAVAAASRDRVRYEYDFGDSWEHDILVEQVLSAEPGIAYPRCTGGKRACPPEDCGGVRGYYDLLEILADSSCDEHADRLQWLGLESAADFDPASFDQDATNLALARTAKVLVRGVAGLL
jgi:hypothetical protein